MRVVYISTRYHTNQNGIIAGWQKNGDEVMILAQYSAGVEDHKYLTPVIIGYTRGFERFYDLYVNRLKKNDPFARDIRLRWGVPPIKKIREKLEEFKPDLVILRERNLYTMGCYRLCKKLGLPVIMWNLSPVYAEPGYFKDDIFHRFVRRATPMMRFTPVRQVGINMEGKIRDTYSYFAPFVVEPALDPEDREYFKDGAVNIFEIGKYQERKNHFMMVRVFERLRRKYPELDLKLRIAGECIDEFQEDYYSRLGAFVKKCGVDDAVTLYKNLPKSEVERLYSETDIYVLTSTGEPASITVIEAMSYGVPAISGTDNGTADYIKPGVTGQVFSDGDEDDLLNKMESILRNVKQNVSQMGRAAYDSICGDFGFGAYRKTIDTMLRDREEYIASKDRTGRMP